MTVTQNDTYVGEVAALRRYPIKSMLGEEISSVLVDQLGFEGDRRLAFVDNETGLVATAKHPRLWRGLLKFSASVNEQTVAITFPDGSVVLIDRPGIDMAISRLLGREVTLTDRRPPGAQVERPDPEDVIAQGVEAFVDAPTLEISQGTTGDTFVDFAPIHVLTTATLDHLGVEAIRYRPNVVIATPPGFPPFAETEWVGRQLQLGQVQVRGLLPTPRCSVPTLEHGDLPRNVDALRPLLRDNRVEVEGFGVLPCAGVYVEVLAGGELQQGDRVTLS